MGGGDWSLRLALTSTAPTLDVRLETRCAALAVVGPSGAGKTTLLRMLAGLDRRGRGHVEVAGEAWQAPGTFVPPWVRRVGWVPQDALLFPHLDVAANLRYGQCHGAAPPFERIVELLEIGHLVDRRPRHLSGGERQRVALGRALLSGPRLLLLDEPFAALDRPLRRRLTGLLLRLREAWPVPTVLVSHDPEDVEALAQEIWRLEGGALSAVG